MVLEEKVEHIVPLGDCWYDAERGILVVEGMMNWRGVNHHKITFWGAEPNADGTWNVDGCRYHEHVSPLEALSAIGSELGRDGPKYIKGMWDRVMINPRKREAFFTIVFALPAAAAVYGLLEIIAP